MPADSPNDVAPRSDASSTTGAFIARWERSGSAERANYQLFLSELCDLLGVPRPEPAGPDDSANAYVFERTVTFQHGDGTTSAGRIDLYKRACLVLEAKQGANLTITGMYNVLEKLRSGEPLTAADKKIHEDGLVSVLKQLHDDLDAAVFASYGWPSSLPDAEILTRLVALNAQRSAEESTGLIRWLRPSYQTKSSAPVQQELGGTRSVVSTSPASSATKTNIKSSKLLFPKSLPSKIRLLRDLLAASPSPVTAEEIARMFSRIRPEKIEELLQTLVTLGQAREVEGGRYGG